MINITSMFHVTDMHIIQLITDHICIILNNNNNNNNVNKWRRVIKVSTTTARSERAQRSQQIQDSVIEKHYIPSSQRVDYKNTIIIPETNRILCKKRTRTSIYFAAERNFNRTKDEFAHSICYYDDMKAKEEIIGKYIKVITRSIRQYQYSIANHCCQCGGNHGVCFNSTKNAEVDHSTPQVMKGCKKLKGDKLVFFSLKASLKESHVKLKTFNSILDRVVQEIAQNELRMNDALLSYI